MAWAKPEYSRSRVNAAGDVLILDPLNFDIEDIVRFDQALEVINNWRSSHAYPLQALKMTLRSRAKAIDPRSLVAQRIKRIPAIKVKLAANPGMQLARMHDIGGCRAVMRSVSSVEKLVQIYEEATAKNPRRAGEFVAKYDYINEPKPDGYRSVHFVYKYRSSSEGLKHYDGLRIELQIRSVLQHAWATAVETVDYFTNQAIKSHMGQVSWVRFFALMSSGFARLEDRPIVPNTPNNFSELRAELNKLPEQIQIIQGITKATEEMQRAKGDVYLLKLDSKDRTIQIVSFVKQALAEAEEMYLEEERENRGNPNKQAVLVSTDSLANLRKAYPNYFLDISQFAGWMRQILRERG